MERKRREELQYEIDCGKRPYPWSDTFGDIFAGVGVTVGLAAGIAWLVGASASAGAASTTGQAAAITGKSLLGGVLANLLLKPLRSKAVKFLDCADRCDRLFLIDPDDISLANLPLYGPWELI